MMEIDREYLGQLLLQQGFKTWFLYMFRVLEGRPFKIEPIHDDMFKLAEDILSQRIKRAIENVPPRSAKTTMCKYIVLYTFTVNPRANFIYTSFNQGLLADISKELAALMEHPIYKAMYPQKISYEYLETSPVDDFWRDYFQQQKKDKENIYTNRRITTAQGGSILFAAIGSQITGYGCFDYNTKIITEKGSLRIGEIVERKIKTKVLSYNFKEKKNEWKDIFDYVKNDESDFLQITIDSGETINATPDHVFYLSDGTEIRADKLKPGLELMSYSLDSRNGYREFLRNILSRIILIKDKTNIGFRELFKNPILRACGFISLKADTVGNASPNKTAFDIRNRGSRYAEGLGNFLVRTFIHSNINSIARPNLLKLPVLGKFVKGVFCGCSITKVFNSIVSRVRVDMSALKIGMPDKSKQNEPMNANGLLAIINKKCNTFISFLGSLLFNHRTRARAVNISQFANKISRKPRNRKILNIVKNHEKSPSYCVTLWDNNNFYLSESQVLVHNCGIRGGQGFTGALIIDDANKPADIYSQTMRDKVLRYFEETLLSRLNDSDVLIFNVQQRLHIEDLSGHLKRKYGYYTLSKPLLDINGVCQIPSQYTPDRIAELQHDESMFQAQYQQEPTAEKGRIIKRDWWRYYNPNETPLDGQIIITADTAFKETKTADYSCIQTWELKKDRMNMRDMVVGKWEFPELIQYAKQMWVKWTDPNKINRAKYFFIEDKASGTPLQQTLANEGINAIAWRPQDFDYPENKVARTKTLSWDVFRNLVYLPEGERMTEYLVNEASLFAEDLSHGHDDSVDSASMAHSVWKYYGGGQD